MSRVRDMIAEMNEHFRPTRLRVITAGVTTAIMVLLISVCGFGPCSVDSVEFLGGVVGVLTFPVTWILVVSLVLWTGFFEPFFSQTGVSSELAGFVVLTVLAFILYYYVCAVEWIVRKLIALWQKWKGD